MSTAIAPPPVALTPSVAAPAATPPPPEPSLPYNAMAYMRKFTVDEYHRMIVTGILKEGDPVELLQGYLVLKMARNPQHDGPMDLFEGVVGAMIPSGWFLRIQRAITLGESEPEPDYAAVRGTRRDYLERHPEPKEIGLVVEISNTSLNRDRTEKSMIYAEAGIPIYWVVNVEERKIEVYSEPSGPSETPAYAQRAEYAVGDSAPLVLDGKPVGSIAVADVMA